MGWEWNSPPCPFPKHSDCCNAHRPPGLPPYLGRPEPHPHHHPKSWQQQWPGPVDSFETLPGLCHVLRLGYSNLMMNFAGGLAIGCSDDIGNELLLARHVTLNRGIHVYIIKQDQA